MFNSICKVALLPMCLFVFTSFITACGGSGGGTKTITPPVTVLPPTSKLSCDADLVSGKALLIKKVPESLGSAYTKFFCKYTEIIPQNGKPIRFLAQNNISNEQLVRARNILAFYLTPVPGSIEGIDKTMVANAMGDNLAQLLLMNGSDDGTNDSPDGVDGQPLYDTELVIEGSTAYINNDYENHRDAAFEEILHLLHDYGIGTSEPNPTPGANSSYRLAIDAARENAMTNNLWPTAGVDSETLKWIEELRVEGSLSQEYLASVIDSYYGYWGANTQTVGGMGGIYIAKTRDEVLSKDPQGYRVVEQFFSTSINYMARIDPLFSGDFFLTFDPSVSPYTHKSQYLVNARLTGDLDSNLTGNDFDNQLGGNTGTNIINGKNGTDTAIFSGNFSEYTSSVNGSDVIIQDMNSGRDGVATLINIERFQFKDQTLILVNGELTKETL